MSALKLFLLVFVFHAVLLDFSLGDRISAQAENKIFDVNKNVVSEFSVYFYQVLLNIAKMNKYNATFQFVVLLFYYLAVLSNLL